MCKKKSVYTGQKRRREKRRRGCYGQKQSTETQPSENTKTLHCKYTQYSNSTWLLLVKETKEKKKKEKKRGGGWRKSSCYNAWNTISKQKINRSVKCVCSRYYVYQYQYIYIYVNWRSSLALGLLGQQGHIRMTSHMCDERKSTILPSFYNHHHRQCVCVSINQSIFYFMSVHIEVILDKNKNI